MKKLYAGLAAAALTATGIACTAGAAHAEATWPSPYSIDPQDANVSLTVAADGATAYSAWVDSGDDTTIDVATTTLATGATPPVQRVSTPDASIDDTTVTSTGLLVAVGQPDGPDSPNLLIGNVDDPAFHVADLTALDSVERLAVSPNGHWAAVVGTDTDTGAEAVALVDISSTPTVSSTTALPDDSAYIDDIAVDNAGAAHAVGDGDEGGRLWTVAAGTVDPTPLDAEPESVALLEDGTVAVGLEGDEENQIAYFAAGGSGTVDIDGSVRHLTASGQTLWASGDSTLTRIDGVSAQTSNTTYGQVWDTAAAADGNTLYVAGATWIPDDTDTENYGHDGPASLFALTAPGAPTGLDAWADGADAQGIDVSWQAAAGGADDDYRITLTDQADPGNVVSTTQEHENVSGGYGWVDVSGVDPTHRYDVKVEAFNGAFYSTALTGQYLPTVPGQGVVSVTGTATVGNTLTGTVTGTWPSAARLDYQWLVSYSNGQSGGLKAIPGATGTALALTPDLVGKYVALSVTAHEDTYADGSAASDPLGPVAAAQGTSAPQPVQVTKVKPATVKANAKKVKLKLLGINVAKAPGKVKVYDGMKLIGKAKIVNGKIVLKLKKHLSHGKHKLKLTYSGSAQVAKFNKSVKLKVK